MTRHVDPEDSKVRLLPPAVDLLIGPAPQFRRRRRHEADGRQNQQAGQQL